jgi:predicted nucleic acid-binding OB-fold protein
MPLLRPPSGGGGKIGDDTQPIALEKSNSRSWPNRISMEREYDIIANSRSSRYFGIISKLSRYNEGKYRKFMPLNSNLPTRVHRLDLLNNASPKFLNKILALAVI